VGELEYLSAYIGTLPLKESKIVSFPYSRHGYLSTSFDVA